MILLIEFEMHMEYLFTTNVKIPFLLKWPSNDHWGPKVTNQVMGNKVILPSPLLEGP